MQLQFQVADPFFDLITTTATSSPFHKTNNDGGVDIISTTRSSLITSSSPPSSCKEFEDMTENLHNICADEFADYELEECATWINFIQESRRAAIEKRSGTSDEFQFPACHAVYILAKAIEEGDTTRKQNDDDDIKLADDEKKQNHQCRYAGGAVAELYLDSKTAMISYIVTTPEFRGKKIGKKIVNYIAWHMNPLCIAFSPNNSPLSALLVDVAQHRDAENEEEKKIAIERQMIWSRLGFSPVDFDMKYPGYLGAARYNVGVWREKFLSNELLSSSSSVATKTNDEGNIKESEIYLDTATFLHFCIIMYTSVWMDEVELLKEQKDKQHINIQQETTVSSSSSSQPNKSMDSRLLDPVVLKQTIDNTVQDLHEEFKKFRKQMLVSDKYWR